MIREEVNTLDVPLKKYFGHDGFRNGQREIIESIMNGKHTLATLPTGSGKSICYQLPALLGSGTTIVVSPLLSLMVDQVKLLKAQGIKRVTAINSMMSPSERTRVLSQLSHYKIIYCSPEMLQQNQVIERVKHIKIDYFVIDEAHCISQWGHEFRPDFIRLKDVISSLNDTTVLALSATATPVVQDDIINQLNIPMKKLINSMDRPNIALSVLFTEEKLARLERLLSERQIPTMIYFSSRKMSEQVAEYLSERFPNRSIAFYHGGMTNEDRLLIQQQFTADQLDIICCTSAFGMGVNKPNIRLVVHYHMPSNIESFIQEVGRAGRDGASSVSVLLYASGDEELPMQLIDSELPTDKEIREYLNGNTESIESLNETKKRFLDYQYENINEKSIKNTYERLSSHRNHRLQTKRDSVSQLVSWIHAKGCRRTKLFKHFQEDVQPGSPYCCDHCDFSVEDWEMQKEEHIRQRQDSEGSWKSILGSILQRRWNDEEKEAETIGNTR